MSKFTELVQGNISDINQVSLYGATQFGTQAFEDCSNLTTIAIPNSVTSIGTQAFAYCSSLAEITIPSSVTNIGDAAFFNCSNLTSVTIPDGVISIGNSAFRDCSSLPSVTIPNSVESIGSYAFYGCSSLTDCIILRTSGVIPLGSNNFNQTNNKIYVPYSLLQSYKTATNWIEISDKIMGYQTFELNEILPRYNTTHTFTWYPSKADLISKTNGIVANGTATATSAGEWYCDKPGITVAIEIDLINSAKTTSFIRPTSSSNANQTEYIYFDTVASTTQYPIVANCTVTNYRNSAVHGILGYGNRSINYGSPIEFKSYSSSDPDHKLRVTFDTTGRLYIEMFGSYQTYVPPVYFYDYWQQITINSIKQTIYEYQN